MGGLIETKMNGTKNFGMKCKKNGLKKCSDVEQSVLTL